MAPLSSHDFATVDVLPLFWMQALHPSFKCDFVVAALHSKVVRAANTYYNEFFAMDERNLYNALLRRCRENATWRADILGGRFASIVVS
jgi:hypothetical protein